MSDPDKPRAPSSPRDRVRARAQRLAQMAVIAAAPVLNTACDPAPSPSCSTTSAADLAKEVSASAVWFKDASGAFLIQLTVQGQTWDVTLVDHGFTVTGATPSAIDGSGTALDITLTPDAGATQITLDGKITCSPLTTDYHLTLTLSGTPTEGAIVPVTVN